MRSLVPRISLCLALAACSSEPTPVQPPLVTFDLRNGSAVPVFIHPECSIEDAAAKTNAHVVSQTFDLPPAERIALDLAVTP